MKIDATAVFALSMLVLTSCVLVYTTATKNQTTLKAIRIFLLIGNIIGFAVFLTSFYYLIFGYDDSLRWAYFSSGLLLTLSTSSMYHSMKKLKS